MGCLLSTETMYSMPCCMQAFLTAQLRVQENHMMIAVSRIDLEDRVSLPRKGLRLRVSSILNRLGLRLYVSCLISLFIFQSAYPEIHFQLPGYVATNGVPKPSVRQPVNATLVPQRTIIVLALPKLYFIIFSLVLPAGIPPADQSIQRSHRTLQCDVRLYTSGKRTYSRTGCVRDMWMGFAKNPALWQPRCPR
jgi:hypothetical protein